MERYSSWIGFHWTAHPTVAAATALACLLLVFSSCGSDNGAAPLAGDDGNNNAGTYDPPAITQSEMTGALNVARNQQTATLLVDGRVLVIGGFDGTSPLSSCEIYNPKTRTWRLTTSMTDARVTHTATLLADGRVLVTGGADNSQKSIYWFEVFDPADGKWTPVVKTGTHPTAMERSRSSHTATLLPDSTVLLAGGWNSGTSDYVRSAEIYDPATHTSTLLGGASPSMIRKRNGHVAVALKDGSVLVAGGFNNEDGYLPYCEIYDPGAQTWSAAAAMSVPRTLHTACLLADGRVLVAGGKNAVSTNTPTCEVYDPVADKWSPLDGFRQIRSGHSMALLHDGRILVAGNFNSASTEIFTWSGPSGTWATHDNMFESRQLFTMTVFSNDVVLISGGSKINDYLASCELYVP